MTALYLVFVATIAAFIGQHVVRKLIIVMGRASIIIFILAFTIFVSAISLGELAPLTVYEYLSRRKISAAISQRTNYIFLIHERSFSLNRWSWHFEHDWQDSTAWIHGIREPLQVQFVILCSIHILDDHRCRTRVSRKAKIGFFYLWDKGDKILLFYSI